LTLPRQLPAVKSEEGKCALAMAEAGGAWSLQRTGM